MKPRCFALSSMPRIFASKRSMSWKFRAFTLGADSAGIGRIGMSGCAAFAAFAVLAAVAAVAAVAALATFAGLAYVARTNINPTAQVSKLQPCNRSSN